MVQVDSLLGCEHVDAHMRADGVVGVQVGLVPGVELDVVLGRLVQTEEAFLLIGSEAAFDDRVLIGRALVDVEVLQSQLGAPGVEAALKLQPVVSLDVAQGEGEPLRGLIQGQQGPCLVQPLGSIIPTL